MVKEISGVWNVATALPLPGAAIDEVVYTLESNFVDLLELLKSGSAGVNLHTKLLCLVIQILYFLLLVLVYFRLMRMA